MSATKWKDPLLEYLAKNTTSTLDRPPLHRPRLGRVGFVPAGAVDCTLADVHDWQQDDTLHERLGLTADRYPRIAFNMNLFDWRPWGRLSTVTNGTRRDGRPGGSVGVQHPNSAMGMRVILSGPLADFRAWLWTVQTERDEAVYLTRRPSVYRPAGETK